MKAKILLCVFGLFFYNAKAQVSEYYINKSNTNNFDESMNAWRGWGGWIDVKNSGDFKFSNFNTLTVSPTVMKYITGFYSWSESEGNNVGQHETYLISLSENKPNTDYKMFFDNVKIEYTHTFGRTDKEFNFSGTGRVYSKDLTFEQMKSGYASGTVYFYFNLPNSKFYFAALINRKSIAEMESEDDEIMEANRKKQQQTNDNIKKIGESLRILLQKKRN